VAEERQELRKRTPPQTPPAATSRPPSRPSGTSGTQYPSSLFLSASGTPASGTPGT
jgi:hypothetical protein